MALGYDNTPECKKCGKKIPANESGLCPKCIRRIKAGE